MRQDEIGLRSRWIIRAREWDDPRARYPNLWHEGMPRQLLASDRVVRRLRLGDLLAVFHPDSQHHADRSERFVGLSRVVGLRQADRLGFGWVELSTAHRFAPPLDLGVVPGRAFVCCDPGWSSPEVELFRRVFAAAVGAGWRPASGEGASEPEPPIEPGAGAGVEPPPGTAQENVETAGEQAPAPSPRRGAREPVRSFAGVDFSGDMRDPRDATWLAVGELRGSRLKITRLEATGRHGLQRYLRDPDRVLMSVEAIGLDFPFGLPLSFAESLLGGPFPEEGWWALAKRLEQVSRPQYLAALQDFRDQRGEVKRLTDEKADACSPLHRIDPDLGPMAYHGIRMIAEDRSRYALRPFETAQGRLLLEVYPAGLVRRLAPAGDPGEPQARHRAILEILSALDSLPLDVGEPLRRACLSRRDALDAVIAARCAALAVLSGEADRTADVLSPGDGERIRREGWIYGLGEVLG